QFCGATIVNAAREKRVLLVRNKTLKGQDSNAGCRIAVIRRSFIIPNQHADGRAQRQQKHRHSGNNWISPGPTPETHRRRKWTSHNGMPSEPAFKVSGQLASGAIARVWLSLQTFGADGFQIAVQRWREGA